MRSPDRNIQSSRFTASMNAQIQNPNRPTVNAIIARKKTIIINAPNPNAASKTSPNSRDPISVSAETYRTLKRSAEITNLRNREGPACTRRGFLRAQRLVWQHELARNAGM